MSGTGTSRLLWVEKYRPESLGDIVGHDQVVERLRQYVDDDEMPHLLFAGKQGVGKTACITAFAREKYGENWRNNVMELNASDERGIDTVREKIKSRAVEGSADGDNQFQIIFLDEADQLSRDAQPALRRVMEDYADVTRFVLSCNYPNQIIGPIQSRCAMFRITPLADDHIREVLHNIAEQEGVDVDEAAIDKLVVYARGDARKAINTFQASTDGDTLDVTDIEVVVGIVDEDLIRDIIDTAVGGGLDEAFRRLDNEVLKEGVSTEVLTNTLLRVIKDLDISDQVMYKVLDKLAECDWRIRRGANPNVHFHSLLADIQAAYHAPDPYPNPSEMGPAAPYDEG